MPKLTLGLADYARIMPLARGEITVPGLELEVITGRAGAWPERAAILKRGLTDPAMDAAESSMGGHLLRIDQGDRRFVALPCFVLRNFTARDLYVRQGSGLESVADLRGKRVGMYSWVASGSIWYRHFLRWAGLALDDVEWVIGEVDVPNITSHTAALPAHVRAAPPGRSLSAMLLAGEIDAVYSPPRPDAYHPTRGPIVRLLPDIRALEQRYWAKTGVFPPQHLVVVRRDVWERDRSVAKRLTAAFMANNAAFETAQRRFPYVTPWLDLELDEVDALMGADYHQDGLDARNRAQVAAFCRTAFEAGLTTKLISVEDYFAEYLASPEV